MSGPGRQLMGLVGRMTEDEQARVLQYALDLVAGDVESPHSPVAASPARDRLG